MQGCTHASLHYKIYDTCAPKKKSSILKFFSFFQLSILEFYADSDFKIKFLRICLFDGA